MTEVPALWVGDTLGHSLGANYELQEDKNGARLDRIIKAFQRLNSSPCVRETALALGHSEHMSSPPFTQWSDVIYST